MSCSSALTLRGLLRTGNQPAQAVAENRREPGADLVGAARDRRLACSSITRSSMLSAKVTPAALMACRSMGASS